MGGRGSARTANTKGEAGDNSQPAPGQQAGHNQLISTNPNLNEANYLSDPELPQPDNFGKENPLLDKAIHQMTHPTPGSLWSSRPKTKTSTPPSTTTPTKTATPRAKKPTKKKTTPPIKKPILDPNKKKKKKK